MSLATKFRNATIAQSNEPLTDDAIRAAAPSIFADGKHERRSDRYTYIPTIEVLNGLRREGFQPFMACQARPRDRSRTGFAKHMLRLRHESQINSDEANEIVLVNSHDGTSSYQMLAGVYRFVCNNGMVVGDTVEDLRVPHRGDVVGHVIEGAYRVLDDFERVDESRDGMQAIPLDDQERLAFARAAIDLRWEPGKAPVTAAQVERPRRLEDSATNLWTTFNVVQEKLVRGGLPGQTRKGKRTRTRPIQGIDGNVALNRALWTLAEEMRRIKAA
ncbi:MAG: DUF945 domain-containing protein [Methylothermaceae bacterium]|nr:DUF945 domain-containing protein [Methylothermaceae bacterium]